MKRLICYQIVTSELDVSALPSSFTFLTGGSTFLSHSTFEEIYSFRTDPRSVNATVLLTVDPSSYVDSDKPTESGIDAPYFQGSPHPIAWFREGGMEVDLSNGTNAGEGKRMNGKMWMTSLGHTNESESTTTVHLFLPSEENELMAYRFRIAAWRGDLHLQHVEAGLRWALADSR